jgi:hypothetical protein
MVLDLSKSRMISGWGKPKPALTVQRLAATAITAAIVIAATTVSYFID